MSKNLIWGVSALFLIVFSSLAFATKAHATNCLDYSSRFNAACTANFRYEAQWIYFNHPQVGEQKFQVRRVVRKSNNTVESANFNFEGDCTVTNKCHLREMEFIDLYVNAFREEVVTEGFFVYRECDSTREVCCYEDGRCDQVHSAPIGLQSDFDSNLAATNEVNHRARAGLIRELLVNTVQGIANALGSELVERALDDGVPNEEFRESLLDGSPFLNVQGTNGATACRVVGDECQVINGNLDSSGGFLQHDHGAAFNSELERFVREWYLSQGKHCTQNMQCDTNDSCRITLSCH